MTGQRRPTVTPYLVAELVAEGETVPVTVHVIDHPDGRVLVDTGFTALHPAVADLQPTLVPEGLRAVEEAGVDLVVNTHLHFDHCGGNHRFAGRPTCSGRSWTTPARSPTTRSPRGSTRRA